jgi:hypothetical protein
MKSNGAAKLTCCEADFNFRRGLARRCMPMRRRAIPMMSESERPHLGLSHRRGVGFEDSADNGAIGNHVVVVIVPLA